nr:unnamed protein product [Digitaria exilis]
MWLLHVVKMKDKYVSEEVTHKDGGPLMMNAFEMITLSQGLDLSALFDRQQIRLEGMSSNRMGQFAVVLEVFEVAPSLFMVDVRKVAGDTLEYHRFYKNLCSKLDSIIWRPVEVSAKSSLLRTTTC